MNMLGEALVEDRADDELGSAHALQVHVCRSCGIQHCKPGGWVQGKRVGNDLAWLPIWEEEDDGESRPPTFLLRGSEPSGAPLFAPARWNEIRKRQFKSMPAMECFRALDSAEVALMLQASAPWLLGRFPESVRLKRVIVKAVSDGELSERLEFADQALADWYAEAGSAPGSTRGDRIRSGGSLGSVWPAPCRSRALAGALRDACVQARPSLGDAEHREGHPLAERPPRLES